MRHPDLALMSALAIAQGYASGADVGKVERQVELAHAALDICLGVERSFGHAYDTDSDVAGSDAVAYLMGLVEDVRRATQAARGDAQPLTLDAAERAAAVAGLRLLAKALEGEDEVPADLEAIWTDGGNLFAPLDGAAIDTLVNRINGTPQA